MQDIIIFDIDGVLANSDHREHLLPDWDAFFEECEDDAPKDIIDLPYLLSMCLGCEIVLLTTRPDSIREKTENWLKRNNVYYNRLIMATNDFPPSFSAAVFKKKVVDDLAKTWNILYIFEDDPKTIRALEEYKVVPILSGIYTVEERKW